jgi:hypothetical protein
MVGLFVFNGLPYPSTVLFFTVLEDRLICFVNLNARFYGIAVDAPKELGIITQRFTLVTEKQHQLVKCMNKIQSLKVVAHEENPYSGRRWRGEKRKMDYALIFTKKHVLT